MNQREAVYTITHSILKENGVSFEDGGNVSSVVTDEYRKQIIEAIVTSFQSGKIDFKDTPSNQEKLNDTSKLRAYTSGLVSNWFRKDKRFNGGATYRAKNPGSRAGQGDPAMKNLKLLKKKFEGTDKVKDIDEAIAARTAELAAAKAKKVEVDLEAIPQELKDTLGL